MEENFNHKFGFHNSKANLVYFKAAGDTYS